MFSASRPFVSAISALTAAPAYTATNGIELLRRPHLRLYLVEQLLDLRTFELGDIVLIFKKHAERVGNGGRIERNDVELGQRGGPIQRFGNSGRLEHILLAQRLHEGDDLLGKLFADARDFGADDG